VAGPARVLPAGEILAQRFTPAWIVSLAIVISTAVWIGFFAYRHVDYSHSLWWTFAFEADAPRMLRASLVVVLLAAAFLAMNLLRPARPEPGVASSEDLTRAGELIGGCSQALANAALSGDKRLLFSAAGDAFLMYQINGRSWVALGDPIGARAGQEELVWRFRELSDRHGGWTVFYQVSAEQLPLYIDLGLAVMKLGEEARVSLPDFSLEGSARAELRTQRRRAERDGATFEVLQPQQLPPLLPKLRAISDAWLEDKAVAEKSFSVGAFSRAYISHFPVAVVRCASEPVAFASLWIAGTGEEIAVDLMRFGAGCAARRDGFPVRRAHALGPGAGLSLAQSRHGAARRPGAPPAGAGLASGRQLRVSATASTSTTSTGCAATRRNSIRSGNPNIWPRRAAGAAARAARHLGADLRRRQGAVCKMNRS
jgi:lysylphosphatidylglycerol synthetase-like protein (DUF2156 family)